MRRYALVLSLVLLTVLGRLVPATAADTTVDAAMLRYPDISATQIVFIYDNDVWVAPKAGGVAVPLSSPAGRESSPKFSPDGSMIAFGANYDGNLEIYTMPVGGGLPQRLTCDPDDDRVLDYAPDGRVLFITRQPGYPFGAGFFYADPAGGLPTPLPVAYGAFGAIKEGGDWLAFTPYSGETMTWKRYQGGMAADIWLFNLKTLESKRITDHPGGDDLPMWHGDLLYYLSDAGAEHRRNIWVYDTQTGERRQVTSYSEYDVRWPSIGPDSIVFQYGSELRVLDLASATVATVNITIPGDHPNVRTQLIDVSEQLSVMSPSPNAKRVVGAFRGDIWTVPAKDGFPRNLTGTNGAAERSPAWSPDGQWIAYFSDASGEYELYVRPSDGSGEARQLTSGSKTFYGGLLWAPDSKKLSYIEKSGKFYVYLLDAGETVLIDENPWGRYGISGTWAKDSNWIAYGVLDDRSAMSYIVLYDLAQRVKHPITTAAFECSEPVFDLSGDWLYFRTNQNIDLRFGELDQTFISSDSALLAALPLRADVKNPFAPINDDEELKPAEDGGAEDGSAADAKPDEAAPDAEATESAADGEPGADDAPSAEKDDAAAGTPEPLKIDFDGIERRVILLPLGGSSYVNLAGGDQAVFYIKGQWWENGKLMQYSLADKEEKLILDNVDSFDLTPDGKNLLISSQGKFFFTNAGPGANLDQEIPLRNMLVELDPRQEWRQMVRDAWRIYRDFFYDPGMHGVDWPAQLDRALKLVEHAANKEDVGYILGEMIGELNVGHAYLWSIPSEDSAQLGLGRLGCDFATAIDADGHSGIQISKIYRGGDFEYDQRGPLSQPGVDVHEGDFLLAVNGAPLSAGRSPYALLAGTAGQPTQLTVSAKAVRDDSAREVLVTPVGEDGELRLRAWIEGRRQYVQAQSGGRLGYIYVRDTGDEGLADLQRQFLSQKEYDGLIIDERWNGGGMIPHRFIEMLNRPVLCYWAVRDGHNWRTPSDTHPGPMAMLINQHAGSGGDAFPYFFRKLGLGPLIGVRTWGGLVGISGNPGLIDGSFLTVPTFGIYELDGTWTIEGYGVDPDIEVVDDPTLAAQGQDPQLDKAIEVVLEELKTNPWQETPKPVYPNRSGAGVKPDEK